jgi:hypothetical protein
MGHPGLDEQMVALGHERQRLKIAGSQTHEALAVLELHVDLVPDSSFEPVYRGRIVRRGPDATVGTRGVSAHREHQAGRERGGSEQLISSHDHTPIWPEATPRALPAQA